MRDKEIEALLISSVRTLPLRDGGSCTTRQFKITWDTYDDLVEFVEVITPEFVTTIALNACQKVKRDFDEVFRYAVSILNDRYYDEARSAMIRERNELKEQLRRLGKQ